MQTIQSDAVVSFYYTLKNEQGEELESNQGHTPMAYLHGHNNMIPGLEAAMEGHAVGDEFTVTLSPEEGYGVREEGQEIKVPVKHLQGLPQGSKTWKPGMIALVETDQGRRHVTVVKMGRFMITVDTNLPLEGQTLSYDIKIDDIRAASDVEIALGHAHGVGGHHHD